MKRINDETLMIHILFCLISRDSYGRMTEGVNHDYESIYCLLLPLMDPESDYKLKINNLLVKMHLSELIDLGNKDTISGMPTSIKVRPEGKSLCRYIEEI